MLAQDKEISLPFTLHFAGKPNFFPRPCRQLLQCILIPVVGDESVPILQPPHHVPTEGSIVSLELYSICLCQFESVTG